MLVSHHSHRSTQIKTYSWDNAQVVLAGNKCDMEEERVVSVDSGRLLAEQLGKSVAELLYDPPLLPADVQLLPLRQVSSSSRRAPRTTST